MLKKILRFLSSMQFALILLGILIAACVAGSLVTQGESYIWYAETYGERAAGAIMALHLDDTFHSPWFTAITVFLCINLIACNLIRIAPLKKRWDRMADGEKAVPEKTKLTGIVPEAADSSFNAMGFHSVKEGETSDGKPMRYACKNRPGIFGAWVCHLGILLLILGFGLGQVYRIEYTLYGVPGQTKEIGDTGLLATIDDFRTDRREDGSASQYTTELTVRRPSDGTDESGTISVNSPATMYGLRFYQNSTGWAAHVRVLKDGEELQDEVVCAGDFIAVKDKPDLVIYFNAFYPDYEVSGGRPSTKSMELNNPAYLYSIYFQGNIVGMNALMSGEEVTIDSYTVTFSQPHSYTLLQVKRDPLIPLALAGGFVTLLGLILALYVQPAAMRAVRNEDGSFVVQAYSRKGGAIFEEKFREVFGNAEDPEDGVSEGEEGGV
ncbi:MAG: cytochrome c biogenesis protein ResB [Lachnospiraceae bacterium]|nr:cytochrome c biogenesis protein ResB [Lachnospiraceae bacterium]